MNGGLISLDCVHPTTIGYGIVAEAFLEVMKSAGIYQDSLISSPPQLWNDVLVAAQHYSTLWDIVFNVIT